MALSDLQRADVNRRLKAFCDARVPLAVRDEVRGSFRISLTYDAPAAAGKTTEHTDTYHGRFVRLMPNEKLIEVDEFETDDPALRGEMTITITLADGNGGTDLVAVHAGLPSAVSPADNETGWRMALGKLAALVETGSNTRTPGLAP